MSKAKPLSRNPARRHSRTPGEKVTASFYASALDEAERQEFQAAAGIEGIDDEIALMRLRIKDIVHADEIEDLAMAMRTLARLVSTRYNITRHDKKGIKYAIGNVLRDIALPLGITIGSQLK